VILRVLLTVGLLPFGNAIPSPVPRSATVAQNRTASELPTESQPRGEAAGFPGREPSHEAEGGERGDGGLPGVSGPAPSPGLPSSIDLDFSAPAGCPDGDAVRSEVLRLTGDAAQGSHHLKARASILPATGTGFILSLATEFDGVAGERTLAGLSCESLTDAAALMLALLLNPDLALGQAPPAVDRQAPPEVTTAASTNDRRSGRRWRVGAHGGIQTGVVKDLSSSFALSLGIALGRLSLRLMPGMTPPQNIYVDAERGIGGRLWLVTAAAQACWDAAVGWLAVSPCLGVDVTRLQGHGLGVLRPRDATAYWASAELAVFAGLPVGHGVRLELGAIGVLPFRRPTVYLDDGIGPVSRPAAFGLKALAGLGWVFE
jgi:hypothetical protein